MSEEILYIVSDYVQWQEYTDLVMDSNLFYLLFFFF